MIARKHLFWQFILFIFVALASVYFVLKAQGQTPYSGVFEEQGEILFSGDQNRPIYWAYPLNWWLLSVGFAQFPFEFAAQSWKFLNSVFILSGIAIMIWAVRPTLIVTLAFAGFTLSMSATALTLVLGQTSALMFLGASFFIFAWIFGGIVVCILAVYRSENLGKILNLNRLKIATFRGRPLPLLPSRDLQPFVWLSFRGSSHGDRSNEPR